MALLSGLEPWLANLIIGLYLVAVMLLGGIVLARARQSPLWVFLLLVPYVSLIAVYIFAFVRWPGFDEATARRARRGTG